MEFSIFNRTLHYFCVYIILLTRNMPDNEVSANLNTGYLINGDRLDLVKIKRNSRKSSFLKFAIY